MAEEHEKVFMTLDGASQACEEVIKENYNNLQALWNEVGIPEEQLPPRRRVVYDNLCTMLQQMVDEEKGMRDSYYENIIKCREECIRLSKELETEFKECTEELSVMKKEKHFRNQIKQLLKQRQTKLKEAMELRAKEGELCARLGREPEYIPSDTLLTNEQFKEINTRIGFLSAEKKKREIKLAIAAKDIIDLWTLLDIKARSSREEIIESGELDSFQLSNENMQWLEMAKTNLKLHLEENKKVHTNMMMKLKSLWTRMELEEKEQKLFLDQHTGYSDAVVVRIKEEVHKLEELKLQNIQKFIESTRNEITNFWDLLFYAEDDRKLFGPFYSDKYGEHLLELHEEKLEKLIKEYNENEQLYKNIKTRNNMWSRWEELEFTELDPKRFANRGGNLLKEEKERKQLQKQIPKQEEGIVKAIADWEEQCDTIFTVFGVPFNDFINNQKQELQDRKEQMKENKQRQREEVMQKDLTYGSTPAKTPKRRIAGTQILTPASKRTKMQTVNTPLPGTPPRGTPARAGRTPKPRQFVHSSLISRSPLRTPNKDKQFPRVVVKVPTPNKKRPDTPVKKNKLAEVLPEAVPTVVSNDTESMDSGIVSTLDLENNNIDNYADFEKELSLPSRELMRSSALHESPLRGENVRKSLLQTIQESAPEQHVHSGENS